MDPNATLRLIVDCLSVGDLRGARSAAGDMCCWIRLEGFPPTDTTPRDMVDWMYSQRLISRSVWSDLAARLAVDLFGSLVSPTDAVKTA